MLARREAVRQGARAALGHETDTRPANGRSSILLRLSRESLSPVYLTDVLSESEPYESPRNITKLEAWVA